MCQASKHVIICSLLQVTVAIAFCLQKDHMDIAGFMTEIRDLFSRKASSIVF